VLPAGPRRLHALVGAPPQKEIRHRCGQRLPISRERIQIIEAQAQAQIQEQDEEPRGLPFGGAGGNLCSCRLGICH